jgi:hypothetical protein
LVLAACCLLLCCLLLCCLLLAPFAYTLPAHLILPCACNRTILVRGSSASSNGLNAQQRFKVVPS